MSDQKNFVEQISLKCWELAKEVGTAVGLKNTRITKNGGEGKNDQNAVPKLVDIVCRHEGFWSTLITEVQTSAEKVFKERTADGKDIYEHYDKLTVHVTSTTHWPWKTIGLLFHAAVIIALSVVAVKFFVMK